MPLQAGTSTEAALRRLRKDRPDLHAQVLAGTLTLHVAIIQAGFRKPRKSDLQPGLIRLLHAWNRASTEEQQAFLAWLSALHSSDGSDAE